MIYLRISEAKLIKTVGVNPIYELDGKHYVGVESLTIDGEEVEHSIECPSLEEAENICNDFKNMSSVI